MQPYTRETTRLDRESGVGLSLRTRTRSLQLVYRRLPAPNRGNTPRRFACGLVLGSLIIAGAFGYGVSIGTLTLSALIVLAFYRVGRG